MVGPQQELLGFEVTPHHSPPCRELCWAEPRVPVKQNVLFSAQNCREKGKGSAGLGMLAKLSILQSPPGHQLVWDM